MNTDLSTSKFEQEIREGKRFGFGSNWQKFLSVLDEERIIEAEKSLQQMLQLQNLEGKTFLDIGSGSGLFSLAARRLGAKVHSLDYDPQSVACTEELRRLYFPDDNNWAIEKGSALDTDYIKSLGQFDIVYSWGVLHHTGSMWKALETASFPVSHGGVLFIAIYNDQGDISKFWLKVKQIYCSGIFGKILTSFPIILYWIVGGFVKDLLQGKNPFLRSLNYKSQRGMSRWHDWFDWLGGLPFEVAKPEEIFEFYEEKNFVLKSLITCGGGLGCNQFIFKRQ